MDKLRLEIRAMDEVGSSNVVWHGASASLCFFNWFLDELMFPFQIQPDLRELMETMNRMSNMPPESEAKEKVSLW